MKTRRFKKGELTQESYDILMFDLGCLTEAILTSDQYYHYLLLKGNIEDIYGKKIVNKHNKDNGC